MGWTYQAAKFYKECGKIDRKAECDNLVTWENDLIKFEVLKSAVKGSTYYAAVRKTEKDTKKVSVTAIVILTHTAMRDYCNFGWKDIEECCGPCEDDCPKSILELLTETESKYANEWRERCWAKIKAKKSDNHSLSKLKYGAVIEFNIGSKTYRVKKMEPYYQFKTAWFMTTDKLSYIPKKHIKNWKLVEA